MTVARLEVQPQFEAGCREEPLKGWEGRLTKVALVSRDHRCLHAGPFRQSLLAEACFEASQGQ
jgi:hypothetical protein